MLNVFRNMKERKLLIAVCHVPEKHAVVIEDMEKKRIGKRSYAFRNELRFHIIWYSNIHHRVQTLLLAKDHIVFPGYKNCVILSQIIVACSVASLNKAIELNYPSTIALSCWVTYDTD